MKALADQLGDFFLREPIRRQGGSNRYKRDCHLDSKRLEIKSTCLAKAPRLASTTCRACSPFRSRKPGSEKKASTASAKVAASSTVTKASACLSKAAISVKLKSCGPLIRGLDKAAGSKRLCPPTGAKLPPTQATSEA